MKLLKIPEIALAIFFFSLPDTQAQLKKGNETPDAKLEREQLGNVPVALHGRVVDQEGQPLNGVLVRLQLQVGFMLTPSQAHTRWDIIELATNPSGHFTLGNKKAGSITLISLVKDGYAGSVKNPTNFEFVHSHIPRHVPDPQNPVVLRMYKLRGAEPMIHIRQSGGIPCDGTTTNFDVFTGLRTSTNRNLLVTFTRVPLHIQRGQRHDSAVKLEIAGGGIMATGDEFTYLAPEDGYSPSVTIEHKANDPLWNSSINRTFYVKTREGYFGLLKIELATFFEPPPTQFTYESWVNPAGSRVLEYDALKQVVPGRARAK